MDPEKSSGEKGTGAVNPAPELDACFLYEDDSDQDAFRFPLPTIGESNGGPEDLMALSSPSTFGLDVPLEPSEEIPLHQAAGTRVARFGSKFLSMGVGTQNIEGRFDARNVTKPIVAAGQVTDRGQGVWLNGDGGFILDVKSARKIGKLLGDKRGFIELRTQKGVFVITCEEQSSSLFPLVEQESSRGRQMDRGEVEVEEERQARVNSAPVLPTDRERRARGHACNVSQLVRGVCGRVCHRRFPQTFSE